MEKPLSLILLTLGGFIIGAAVLAMLFPTIARTGNAIAKDRAGTAGQSSEEITLVNAYAELDATGAWQDVDADTYFDVWMWVKNTGGTTVRDTDETDVFVHSAGTAERVPHTSDAGASYPQWSAAVEGGGEFVVTATLKVTVHYATTLADGDYTLEVVTPNGARSIGAFVF